MFESLPMGEAEILDIVPRQSDPTLTPSTVTIKYDDGNGATSSLFSLPSLLSPHIHYSINEKLSS
jgi:hypothetical protein